MKIRTILLLACHFVSWYFGQALAQSIDHSIRYIIVHNDNATPIFPVIESPENGNCVPGSTSVNRILLPQGVAPGKTVKVYMPNKCWYNAGRVLIFTADITTFESRIDVNQRTQKGVAAACFALNTDKTDGAPVSCFQGKAKASYPLDSPAQLTEYTFDADDPVTGKPSPDPDKGRLMTDIDISYVDETFLPIAMAIDTGGLAGYMGTTMAYVDFTTRVNAFLTKANWSTFASYTNQNWDNNLFHDLIPHTYHTMGGFNLVNSVNTKATSGLYKASQSEAYLIENLSVNQKGQPSNPSETALVAKWQQWLAPNQPCKNAPFLNNPAVDKKGFCQQYQATLQWVWTAYNAFKYKDPNYCTFKGGDGKTYQLDDTVCLMEHIIGYTQGPNGGQLPESVQAILRGVPWNAPAKDKEPQLLPLYQYDKWLLFWAPFDSPYNLNPFTRLIHNPDDGINAVAYSFSIDDKYGNFRDEGIGLIINVGGNSLLPNKMMYDPYQQYFVTWADKSWDHATVCGRALSLYQRPGNSRVSFWNNGLKQDYCDVVMYNTASSDSHLNFRLTEEPLRQVVDAYTGLNQQVQGLTMDVNFCQQNSSANMVAYCAAANLSPVYTGDISYVSLSDADKPKTTLNIAALVTGSRLNLAPGWLTAKGCGLPAVAGKIDPKNGSSFPFSPGSMSSCQVNLAANNIAVVLALTFDKQGEVIPASFTCTNTITKQACVGALATPNNVNLPPPNAI